MVFISVGEGVLVDVFVEVLVDVGLGVGLEVLVSV